MQNDYSFIESNEFQEFSSRYRDEDTNALRLKRLELPFDKEQAIVQIECRKKAIKKIPKLAELLFYPTSISIEQCTSERLAQFHASLFIDCDNVADLTCGLGVDSYYISKIVDQLTSIEISERVASAAIYNFKSLSADNIKVVNCSAEQFVDSIKDNEHFSAMMVDPSRRTHTDQRIRTNSIKDTVPDLNYIIPRISQKTDFLIVKASPMADISQTLSDFTGICDVWILSVKNECKELLFKLDFRKTTALTTIHCINFKGEKTDTFEFPYGEKAAPQSAFPKLGQIIYQPNTSIMKAGAYNLLAERYNLKQISANSHLFLSDDYISDFPGRKFRISAVLTMSKTDIRKLQSLTDSANITCRNFPLTADALRKRLKLKDGGDTYLFATTAFDNSKIIVVTHPETI